MNRMRLASFRNGYEEVRCGKPFRFRWRAALAYEQGRLAANEMRFLGLSLRPWRRRCDRPACVMAVAASLARKRRSA